MKKKAVIWQPFPIIIMYPCMNNVKNKKLPLHVETAF